MRLSCDDPQSGAVQVHDARRLRPDALMPVQVHVSMGRAIGKGPGPQGGIGITFLLSNFFCRIAKTKSIELICCRIGEQIHRISFCRIARKITKGSPRAQGPRAWTSKISSCWVHAPEAASGRGDEAMARQCASGPRTPNPDLSQVKKNQASAPGHVPHRNINKHTTWPGTGIGFWNLAHNTSNKSIS